MLVVLMADAIANLCTHHRSLPLALAAIANKPRFPQHFAGLSRGEGDRPLLGQRPKGHSYDSSTIRPITPESLRT